MEKSSLREFPVQFKRHLVDLFFNTLDDIPKIVELRDGFARRGEGYDTELFFWMDPELHPLHLKEIRDVLENPELNLLPTKIEEYLLRYKNYYRL